MHALAITPGFDVAIRPLMQHHVLSFLLDLRKDLKEKLATSLKALMLLYN